MSKFKLALIQLAVSASKADNIKHAVKLISEAASNGAKLVALPECFNSPYGTSYFGEYAESIPGPSTESLSQAAKDNQVFLIGGSIPEKDNNKLYNTCTVYNPNGELIAKHRKVCKFHTFRVYNPNGELIAKHRKIHLFDIDVPGKIKFQESEVLDSGNNLTTFDTPYCKIGVGICYDIRFAELAQIYSRGGCKLLVYPGAFNMTTGPAHWELLQRGRALDNQLYVATVSPARDENASYVAWGHSTVVNPWGEVTSTTEEKETVIYSNIDLDYLEQVRGMVPISKQRREDLYELVNKTKNAS